MNNALAIAEQLLQDTTDIWYTSVWETFVGYGILSVLVLILGSVVGWSIKKFFYSKKILFAQDRVFMQIQDLACTNRSSSDFYMQLIHSIKYYLTLYAYIPTKTLTEYELKQLLEKTENQQLATLLIPVLEHACTAKFEQYNFSTQISEQDRQRVLAALKIIMGRSF